MYKRQALIASHNSLEGVMQGLDQTLILSTICSPEDASTRFSPRGCRMIPLPPDLRRQPNQTVPARPKEVTGRQWRSFYNVYFQRKRNLEGHASGLCREWFARVFCRVSLVVSKFLTVQARYHRVYLRAPWKTRGRGEQAFAMPANPTRLLPRRRTSTFISIRIV